MTVTAPAPRARARRRRAPRAIGVIAVTLLLAIIASWLPGVVGTAASVALPWIGFALAALTAIAALFARRVLLLLLAPALVWALAMFPSAPGFAPTAPSSGSTLTIVSQNVRANSGGATASAREIAATSSDVIALTELDAASLAAARGALSDEYPYSYAVGTVGVWSRFPIAETDALTLGLEWKRAVRVVVQAPSSDIAVYVMHAASVRPGHQQSRDTMLTGIADAVAADPADAVMVVGDFNAASADPALNALRAQLDWVRPTDGSLGFTWPTTMPVTRIDHVFARGVAVLASTTMRAGNSDHLATVTTIDDAPGNP